MKKLITAAFLLFAATAARAALPDQITDPATRDVVEALDAKVDAVIATIAASSATLGTPSTVQPVSLGGTGATTASGALANLGAPSVTGTGATGLWHISVDGATLNSQTADRLTTTPVTCSAGQAPLGVNAYGSSVGCFTPIDNLGNHIATKTLTANYGIVATTITASGTVQMQQLVMPNWAVALSTAGSADSFSMAGAATDGTGSLNLAIGQSAAGGNTGDQNTFIGAYTALAANSGSYNTFIGGSAGANNQSGNGNMFLGSNAGGSNTTGNNNVVMGYNAGAALSAGNNNILLGSSADTMDTDEYLNIGNAITGSMIVGSTITFVTAVAAPKFIGDGSALTGIDTIGGAGVLQLDAFGNLTPDDLVVQDSYLIVTGNDIMPL